MDYTKSAADLETEQRNYLCSRLNKVYASQTDELYKQYHMGTVQYETLEECMTAFKKGLVKPYAWIFNEKGESPGGSVNTNSFFFFDPDRDEKGYNKANFHA